VPGHRWSSLSVGTLRFSCILGSLEVRSMYPSCVLETDRSWRRSS
jgi:hypothetical protein